MSLPKPPQLSEPLPLLLMDARASLSLVGTAAFRAALEAERSRTAAGSQEGEEEEEGDTPWTLPSGWAPCRTATLRSWWRRARNWTWTWTSSCNQSQQCLVQQHLLQHLSTSNNQSQYMLQPLQQRSSRCSQWSPVTGTNQQRPLGHPLFNSHIRSTC